MTSRCLAKLTISGNPVRKSNNRIATFRGGVPRVIKSKAALAYYKSFKLQVAALDLRQDILGPLELRCALYQSPVRGNTRAKITTPEEFITHSWTMDLSTEAVMDCLEESGVIRNDRQIVSVLAQKGLSFDNPRVEIELYEFNSLDIEMEL